MSDLVLHLDRENFARATLSLEEAKDLARILGNLRDPYSPAINLYTLLRDAGLDPLAANFNEIYA
jgi:hypothetical protein